MIEDLMTLQAEERNAEVERVKDELLSDNERLGDYIYSELADGDKYAVQATDHITNSYAELASILYQCESIFADLFNGKTLEEIGKRRNLQPFRILESIRKDCHELVERCVVAELTDKFGSDE
jgi:hypothetical protein